MARKASGTDFGNMEWKARDWGYRHPEWEAFLNEAKALTNKVEGRDYHEM